ncbi:MAG TPA: hypothetical protein VMU09_11100 [Acidimicrobiales bacterium]|nr:hypothetical protein [Acidimicrobiales bacterium]
MIERIADEVYATGRRLPHGKVNLDPADPDYWATNLVMENGAMLRLAHEDGKDSVWLEVPDPDPDHLDFSATIETRRGEQVVVPLVGLWAEVTKSWYCEVASGDEVWHYLGWIGRMPLVHPTAQMTGRRAW